MVVEILSPATAAKDRGEKMELYQLQKLTYYPIIDPHFKKTEIYQFEDGAYQPVALNPENFNFTFDDNCTAEVSFADIWD
ncbi:hypothetical protein GCM10027043_33480 [Ferruginibacter profundus]